MDPTRSASSSKKRLGRIPSARGAIRLSEADVEKLIPKEMRPYWPTMTEKQKKEVKKILANTQYLKKECRNFGGEKYNYEKNIEKYEKAMESLNEDIEDVKGKVALNMKIQDELKTKLAKNEEELSNFKTKVGHQLRNKKEADSLKSEISAMKRDIKDKNRKTVKLHKKINIKADQEKEVFSQFSEKLELLKEVRDLIEKNGLMPENKLAVLNDNITDFQFDLALHENDDDRIEQYNREIEKNFPIKK